MNTIRPSNLGRGAAAVAMLLLMLSSQIGSAGSAKLETQTTQQPVPQPPPSTPPVVPPSNSAPGQLSYTNTWNRTGQQPICLQTHALVSSNTLKPEAQSWTITSSVPSLLPGNGAPSGQSVSYTYTAYANESFIVSDDHGNDLYWKGVTGFPPGPRRSGSMGTPPRPSRSTRSAQPRTRPPTSRSRTA